MGQYFINDDELRTIEISAGIQTKLVSGKKLMLSFVEISEGAGMSEHSHFHEQAGIVLVSSNKMGGDKNTGWGGNSSNWGPV